MIEAVSDNPFAKPEYCRACTLFSEPGIVRGDGNPSAKLLYVGEAPGAEEVDYPRFRPERMHPFIGGAGRVRDALLAHAGLKKHVDLFTTNCVKCRPPNNRLPTAHEVACCAKFLIEEIEAVNPNVIIAAGELALNVLCDKQKIGLWRGVPTQGPTFRSGNGGTAERVYKVFPTWHPAFVIRQQYNWPFAVHDLARAAAQSEFPEIRRVPINITRDARAPTHASGLLAAARERRAVTFDFETTGLRASRDSILMCGFVARSGQAEVYDWTTATQQLFQELLDDPSITIVGQNILNFDLPFAEEKGARIPWSRVFDTMTAFHLCNASYGQTTVAEQNAKTFRLMGAEKDLAFIASNHTDIEYWKSREAYKNDLRGVCGLDCVATDRSALHPTEGLVAELARYDMTDLYWKHVLPVHPILQRMTKRGVRVHEEKAVKWSFVLEREADRLEAVLREGLGDPFLNLNSPQQLMDLLYNKLGLPVQYVEDKKRGRRPTANAEAVEHLASIAPENRILGSIVDIRHLRKMKSTYVDSCLEGDGFVHPHFGVSKAATGRFNSWNPNGQNVPEDMREIWIADSDEHVLMSADWNQIEWRLGIVLSADPVGLELLASGVDNHKAVASETLQKPVEDVTDAERYASKFIVYGLGYGRGADSIASGHNLDLPFVKQFIGRFFDRFRVFANWREGNVAFVKKHHYLANAWKRRRWWYTWQITEVYNFPQQSNAADMMYEALIDADAQLPREATLRSTVHDELLLNVPKDIVRETRDCLQAVMQRTFNEIVELSVNPQLVKQYYPNGWFCPADIHVGTNWKMCKSKDPSDKIARAQLEKELGLS